MSMFKNANQADGMDRLKHSHHLYYSAVAPVIVTTKECDFSVLCAVDRW